MFRFLEISVSGWDLLPPVTIPLDRDVVIITGPNGSGKTTLLDALRQLLDAPRLSSKRRVQNYLRKPDQHAIISAVVSNASAGGGQQPFSHLRLLTPEITIACGLIPSTNGPPDKRFAILAGRAAPEKVRDSLLDPKQAYSPERYKRELEHAGVSPSLMRVLGIGQGEMNRLSETKPRELYLQVLDMLGELPILERYRAAAKKYNATAEEIHRQSMGLERQMTELQGANLDLAKRVQWEQAEAKVVELRARLPASEFQDFLKQRAEDTTKLKEFRTKVSNGDIELRRLDAIAASASEEAVKLERHLEEVRASRKTATETWAAAKEAHGTASARVADLTAKWDEFQKLPVEDISAVESAAAALDARVFSVRDRVHHLQTEIKSAEQKIASLEAGVDVFPAPVQATLDALDARGVRYVVLASKLEVADADMGQAVEAALGDSRYSLVVAPGERNRAISAASELGFPGPIYSGALSPAERKTGSLLVPSGMPEWLGNFDSGVKLDATGYWHDQRGTWVAPPRERVLGAAGRQAELERVRDALRKLGSEEKAASELLSALERDRTALSKRLESARRRAFLIEETRPLLELRASLSQLAASLKEADLARSQAERAADDAETSLRAATGRRAEAASAVTNKRSIVEGERQGITKLEEGLVALDKTLTGLRSEISVELQSKAQRFELDGKGTVEGDLKRAEETLRSLPPPPDETIRALVKNLEQNVEDLRQHVRKRREEQDQLREELNECRTRYIASVSLTLQEYKRRVKAFAAIADVDVEMLLPTLTDDDRALEEAAIDVTFAFDKKDERLPLGDPSFSGGQKVISGLIVLMGMAETGGQGFFMLDEPFAHLSVDRVDQVGEFLRNTRSQFIVTAPTSLDMGQLDPASLVIVLRKKKPGEPHAPPPIVAEA